MKLNGEIELHVLEEKIRFLKLKIAEKQRQIHVTRKLLPVKSALDADLAVLQIQVGNILMTKFLGPFAFFFFPPINTNTRKKKNNQRIIMEQIRCLETSLFIWTHESESIIRSVVSDSL